MKKMFKTICFIIIAAFCFSYFERVWADELSVNLNVKKGDVPVEILGANIYANIDGRQTQITVFPENIPFKMNIKAGALRILSFWATEKQQNNKTGLEK